MTLTRREHAVLGYLTDGLTADAIARRTSTRRVLCASTCRTSTPNSAPPTGSAQSSAAVTSGCYTLMTFPGEFQWNIRADMWATSRHSRASTIADLARTDMPEASKTALITQPDLG